MSKITLKEMSYYYTDYYHPVFDSVSLVLDTDWRLGLIGRNGRGKTTLLHLLGGKLEPTAGSIETAVEMDYFPYEDTMKYTKTMDVIKENAGGLKTMEDTMEEIIRGNQEDRFEEYSCIMELYQERDGYEAEGKIRKEAAKLGLPEELLYQEFDTLSGGERTKLLLIALFLKKNNFVLMDEPTNHLDFSGKETVARYLSGKKGFLVVSHDREFLDQVTDHILAINRADITLEQGNYTSWKNNVELREQYEWSIRQKLEQEIYQMENRSRESRGWADLANPQKYYMRTKSRANGAKRYMGQAKRAEDRIQRDLEKKKGLLRNLEESKALDILQEYQEEDWVLTAENISFSYTKEKKPVIDQFNLKVFPGERIWLRGKNGAGKTTLLKLLAGVILPNGKEPWMLTYAQGVRIAWAEQEPKWNCGRIRELWDMEGRDKEQFQKFQQLCECFDLPEGYLERPLTTFSSGERKKADLARALSEPNQLLFLDEPLNYMDVLFREQLERAILESSPTMLFVEHDEKFAKAVATRAVSLGNVETSASMA